MSEEKQPGAERETKKVKPALSPEERKMLKLRAEINSLRPRFIRMNSWRLKRLKDSWRSPRRSLDNKIRLQRKGFPPLVKVGYRGPAVVRGLHPSGFEEVIVHTVEELEKIDPSRQAVRIASTVARRKRIEIIKKAEEKGIRILNAGGA
ncbi:50S ribosomal protein L32e [Infirmifilum lucidum]|uniref:Large ribosomal subunit protein eL32 n=1 Tax=Infirmifilum lucidum TaxID=2776706 RepID=A0A7L9FHZ9_9CREN|nr:50S ribosomal protein L32e [Infirmifilum lucidum]QOJ78385.1 50S ribosomal protein L32e [Infirmifilum lucidum]